MNVERVVVVAAVVLRDGTILAARRTHPPELAGRWELPGGKVEPGERETDALIRELAEELGVSGTVGERVGPEVALPGGGVLRAFRVEPSAGNPSPIVHDAIRWVTKDDLDRLDWAPADLTLLPALRRVLAANGEPQPHHTSPM